MIRKENPIYKFVFVNTHLGYEMSYSVIETNVPLSDLSIIEKSQKLTRSESNTAESFVDQMLTFYYKPDKIIAKVIQKDQKQFIEGYPIYYGYSGNY